jgi:hypothetical protein
MPQPRHPARLRTLQTALPALLTIAVAAPAGAETIASFQSPSHNIGCVVGSSYGARCDIAHRSWKPPARPKSCPSFTGYGQGLIVGKTGPGHVICAGDTALTQGGVLAYRHSRSVGRFTCTSQTSGMTCRNRRTGHGFFLSKDSYRLF